MAAERLKGASYLALALFLLFLAALLAAVPGCGASPVAAKHKESKPTSAAVSTSSSTTGTAGSSPSGTAGSSTTTSAPASQPGAAPPGSSSSWRIALIVLENREYDSVIGDPDAPNLNRLAQEYLLLTNSYARTHPSLPNYLDLVGGSTFGITTDCYSCTVSGSNLGFQLSQAGYNWGAYFGGMPSPCYTGYSSAAGYAKKHNPFAYFPSFMSDPSLCDHLQPIDSLLPALNSASPPQFVMIVPDLCDDGHDCSTSVMDSYVGTLVSQIEATSWWSAHSVIIITFDEGASDAGCCQVADGGHIATILVSPVFQGKGTYNQPIDHAGILRTIEEIYNLPLLGEAADPASGDLLPLFS